MTEDEARDQLRRLVASDTFPTIDGPELTDLLRLARRPDFHGTYDVGVPFPDGSLRTETDGDYRVWEPNRAYPLNTMRVPRRRNGHVYKVSEAGTSGPEDPSWPLTPLGAISDGTVAWVETLAIVWQPTYDLNAAAAEGWRWKAGRVSDRITFGSQGDSYNAEQMYTHCLEMAKYYEGRVVRSVRVFSPLTKPLDMTRLPRAN